MDEIIDAVAAIVVIIETLGADRDELVLVGGTVPLFLVSDPAAPPHRPTNDVDWVVDIETRSAFYRWEDRIRNADSETTSPTPAGGASTGSPWTSCPQIPTFWASKTGGTGTCFARPK